MRLINCQLVFVFLLVFVSCKDSESLSRFPKVTIQQLEIVSLKNEEKLNTKCNGLLFSHSPSIILKSEYTVLHGELKNHGVNFWIKTGPLYYIGDFSDVSFYNCIDWNDERLVESIKKLGPIVGFESKVKVMRADGKILLIVKDEVPYYDCIIAIDGSSGKFFQANFERELSDEILRELLPLFSCVKFLN